jgi:tRNA(His) guanylyltransferase
MPKWSDSDSRCKWFEKNFGNIPYLFPRCPGLVRIDGRAFHSFCRNLRRPFDKRLSQLMIDTTKYLVQECGCAWGYQQSDELSLCWLSEAEDSQIFFDGRRQKIESMTAAMATSFFSREIYRGRIEEKKEATPLFDSRAWSVPDKEEAIFYLNWRMVDCVKNSISMAASTYFSPKELVGQNSARRQEMLFKERSINWNDYPMYFKEGTLIRRVFKNIPFSAEEIEKLPERHEARKNPGLTYTRSVLEYVNEEKRFGSVVNKIGVLFNSEEPIYGV